NFYHNSLSTHCSELQCVTQ
ncbi:hypothetical protein D047_4670B, partial [Vibrio parahaemolyticus VPTS-2010_2]